MSQPQSLPLKQRLGFAKDPIYLVDGSAYVYRAFYAYPDLKRSDGFPTNALFIVLRLLLKLLREENPKYLGFFLDGRGPTFRHELYAPYKAQRTATPEHLITQLEPIGRAVELLGFKVRVSDGVEADDLIASLAMRLKKERPVVIVGADKDLKQCLDENVVLWDPMAKNDKLDTLESFRRDTGLEPKQWPDFQAIIGDSSDNIPGVPGIGPKGAEKIFQRYATLDELCAHPEKLTPAELKKIKPVLEQLPLYRTLTALRTEEGRDISRDDLARASLDATALTAFFQEFEFRSLLRDLPQIADSQPQQEMEPPAQQGNDPVRTEIAPPANELRALVQDQDVGLIQARMGCVLGVREREFLCMEAESLPAILAAATTVYTPDVKFLLKSNDGWNAIPLKAWFDLGVAAYLLNPEDRDYGFPKLQDRYQDNVNVHPQNPALMALAIGRDLRARIESATLDNLMHELEIPLIPVLAHMEEAGIGIDLEAFASFLNEVQKEIAGLSEEIYAVAGGTFNIRSSQQLGQLLFDTLHLKPAGKTPGGSSSTSQAALEKLQGQHPVIDKIMEFRKLEKMRSTYLEPLPKLVDARNRLHTTFNQLATATGRLSSSNPNLQNIPIRGTMGRRMRGCFRAMRGCSLVAADYSQIELRVLAHFSQDQTLLEAFAKDEDIHSRTASLLFDKTPDHVTPDERRNAKTINFGLIYGMGPQKLARDLGITLNEAKAFIERYFHRLHALKQFYESVEETCKEQGYVTTLAGRRRYLPDITSRNNMLQSQARRQAVNTVIQGSAADIIKAAMIKADNDDALRGMEARVILQVHDELVLETPASQARKAGQHLARIMADVVDKKTFHVPLKVDWGHGDTWDEAH